MSVVLRPGHGLILIVIALLTLGVVMVNSAGLNIDAGEAIDLRHVLLGQPRSLCALLALPLIARS